MSNKFRTNELIDRFQNRSHFTIDDLHEFYMEEEPKLKRSTLRWRVYELKQKGFISQVSQGDYTINNGRKEWEPKISDFQKQIFHSIRYQFPYTTFCFWSTEWLVPYAHHIPMKYVILIEPEKDALNAFYNHLNDQVSPVLLDPSIKEIENYLHREKNSIVVKPLISQAPIKDLEIDNEVYFIPKLEKIIVDLITDKKLFSGFQGKELSKIIKNLVNTFSVKESKIKRYSLRRNRWDAVKSIVIPFLREESDSYYDR